MTIVYCPDGVTRLGEHKLSALPIKKAGGVTKFRPKATIPIIIMAVTGLFLPKNMKIFSLSRLFPTTVVAGFLLSTSQVSQATDYVWSGPKLGVSADWSLAKNWKVAASTSVVAQPQIAPTLAAKTVITAPVERISGVPGAGDTATINGGAVVAIDKALTLAALTVQEGSDLRGTGDITVTSALTVNDGLLSGEGRVFIAKDATASFSSQRSGESSGTIINKVIESSGTLNWNAGKFSLQKDLYNRGNVNIADGVVTQIPATLKAVFYNEGRLTKSGAGQSALLLPLKNTGEIYLRGGTLDVGAGFSQAEGSLTLEGGSLSSTGTLRIFGGTVGGTGALNCDVVNDGGTFKPGHSPGYITINGNYTQTANGTLDMEIGGTGMGTTYDHMEITGSAYLDGQLNIIRYNGYLPTAGTSFLLIDCFDIHDNFATIGGLYPGGKLFYRVNYFTSSIVAATVSDTTNPSVAISSPAHNGNYLGVSSVQGTAGDGAGSGIASVTIVLYRYATQTTPTGFLLPNNSWSSTYTIANQLTVSGTTNWSRALPTLAPGQYHVKASAKDFVGNTTSTTNKLFNISPSGSGYVFLPDTTAKRARIAALATDGKLQFSKSF